MTRRETGRGGGEEQREIHRKTGSREDGRKKGGFEKAWTSPGSVDTG